MIAVLMTNQLPETGRYDRPDKFHVLQAEQDVKLAIDSGYDPDSIGSLSNITITADLQRYIAEHKAAAALKETQESDNIKLHTEREEKREQSAQAALDELSDSADREKYMNDYHAFGDIQYTGKQWQRIAQYAKDNKDRITEEWLAKGYTQAEIDKGFRVTEIMANPNATKEEKQYAQEAAKDSKTSIFVKDIGEEAGFEAKQSEGPKPIHAPPPAMQLTRDF